MKTDTINNRIIFDNDDDLYQFAVVPEYVLINDEFGNQYFDWNFTDACQDAIAANCEFIMNDLNSRYLKHGTIDYKGITKPINISGNFDTIFDNIDKEFEAKENKKSKKSKK